MHPNDLLNSPELLLQVVLGSALGRFLPPDGGVSEEFVQFLELYLEDLRSDFELPLTPRIEVLAAGSAQPLKPNALRILVNGRSVWIGPEQDLSQTQNGSALAHWVVTLLVAEPELLVNDGTASYIARTWAGTGVVCFEREMSLPSFRQLLQRLMRRGFRVTRALEWARNRRALNESLAEPTRIAEQIVAPIGSCTLAVQLGGSLYEDAWARSGGSGDAAAGNDKSFDGLMGMLRDGVFYELGVHLPKVSLEREEGLTGNVYRCRLNDRRLLPQPGLEPDQLMVTGSAQALSDLGLPAREGTNPANGNITALVEGGASVAAMLEAKGKTVWDGLGHVVLALSAETRKRIGDFHTTGVSVMTLKLLAQAFPALVAAAEQRFDSAKLTAVFRQLADEEISIRDHRALLEALLAIRRTVVLDPRTADIVLYEADVCTVSSAKPVDELDIDDLSGHCRRVFRRFISHKFAKAGMLNAFTVDAEFEERLRELDFRPLTEDEYDELIRGISRAISTPSREGSNPVLLAGFDVRALMRETIRTYYPDLAVLSRQELMPDMQIRLLGQIAWHPPRAVHTASAHGPLCQNE